MPKTMTLDAQNFVLLSTEEYQELLARAEGISLPQYPEADVEGNRDARAFGMTAIAREIITRRLASGLSQEQLAQRAGINVDHLRGIEEVKHHPKAKILQAIEHALADMEIAGG